jgi:predicted alpha/beta-fold hydrolase
MPPLLGAAAVSAPLDPAASHVAIDAHRLFGPFLLAAYRREVLAVEGAADLTDRLRVAATHARSLREFEETVTVPRFGYPSYATFVEVNRADRVLPDIRVPTLLLTAADDPLVPVASLAGVEWSACPAVAPVIVGGGGHCGFEDLRTVRDNLQDRAIGAFFEGVAEDYATSGASASTASDQGEGSVPSSSAQAQASTEPA